MVKAVTPSLAEPGVWTGMASANVLAPLRWKRVKTHRGSRHRHMPHQKPDIRQRLWPLILNMPNTVAIGRGPYTSTQDIRGLADNVVEAPRVDLLTFDSRLRTQVQVAGCQERSLCIVEVVFGWAGMDGRNTYRREAYPSSSLNQPGLRLGTS
jgi:hypothetical protein